MKYTIFFEWVGLGFTAAGLPSLAQNAHRFRKPTVINPFTNSLIKELKKFKMLTNNLPYCFLQSAIISGCLPCFKHRIPWLFPLFFLFFPDSQSTFLKFSPQIYSLSSKNLLSFWYFFYNSPFSKKLSLTSLTFYLNSLTFPWLLLSFNDFSWLPDLADSLNLMEDSFCKTSKNC